MSARVFSQIQIRQIEATISEARETLARGILRCLEDPLYRAYQRRQREARGP